MSQSTLISPPSPTVALYNDRPATTSREVAKFFGKRHDHVVRDIRNLIANTPKTFHAPNFGEMSEDVEIGNGAVRQDAIFLLFRDGFMLLVMGYTGKKAMQIKIAYIEAFNALEAQVKAMQPQTSALPPNPAQLTKSSTTDRKPLEKLVKVWAQQKSIPHAAAWTQVNAHFNLDSVTHLPIEWIPDAIAYVERKISEGQIQQNQQTTLPEVSLPAVPSLDTTLPGTARMLSDIKKALSILSGSENYMHIIVRMEISRSEDLPFDIEQAINRHIDTAWYGVGIAQSALRAALSLKNIRQAV